MVTRREQRELDIMIIVRWLFMMPFLAVPEISDITKLSDNRIYRLMQALSEEGKVAKVRVAWLFNLQDRWFLTTSGVLWAVENLGLEIQWQVTENGLKWLLRRLPMLECFYQLAPKLWTHTGIRHLGIAIDSPDPDVDAVRYDREHRMREFVWRRDHQIHALHISEIGAWGPLVWLGLTTTVHRMADNVALWMHTLETPLAPGVMPPRPAAWVSVGFDRLSAMHGSAAWPWPVALTVTADGQIMREMEEPGNFSGPLTETSSPADLGKPEKIADWVKRKHSTLWALRNPLAFRVFMAIAEWPSITVEQIERKFPGSTTALPGVIKRLTAAELIISLDDAFYLCDRGRATLAQMDRIHPNSVAATFAFLLNEDGDQRLRVQKHDQAVIDVAIHLENETGGSERLEVFHGWRHVIQVDDDTQVNPDAMVCLVGGQNPPPFYLETEFSAVNRAQAIRKFRPHRRFQQTYGVSLPLLVVCADRAMEELFWEVGAGLNMLTTTLPELLDGVSFGPQSVWRHFGRTQSIEYLEILRLQQAIDRLRNQ